MELISVGDKLPEMAGECTKEVMMFFGSHCESGVFYFDELTGNPYHVFFDGDSLTHEPTHWAYFNKP